MALRHLGHVDLPPNSKAGGLDHAAVHEPTGRIYVAHNVAIGDPGVIEVFDRAGLGRREIVATEAGAHTLSFDATRNIVCAFLPQSHRAAVYEDGA